MKRTLVLSVTGEPIIINGDLRLTVVEIKAKGLVIASPPPEQLEDEPALEKPTGPFGRNKGPPK